MIDLVIPYQISENGIELKYALRSACKYMTGIRDCYLIGDKPAWYTGKHIPFVQTRGNIIWKQRNIFEKVLAACNTPEVSEQFLFMNDDHYLLKEYDAATFPNYFSGCVSLVLGTVYGDYKETIQNTIDLDLEIKLHHYDVHCPIVYDKDNFKCLLWLNWSKPHGYAIKSIYGSTYFDVRHSCNDFKMRRQLEYPELRETIRGRPWFSTGDRTFNADMRKLMNELYPEKSKWEI